MIKIQLQGLCKGVLTQWLLGVMEVILQVYFSQSQQIDIRSLPEVPVTLVFHYGSYGKKKKKNSSWQKLRHLPENDNFHLDTMTSTNSSNDRLVLRQNVEINSNQYFSCDVFFREWNSRPRGLETSLRNHQERCLWVQSYFNDILWFIEPLSVKILEVLQ